MAMQLAAIMKKLDTLDVVEVKLNDLDNQQKAHHLTIGRLELGKGTLSGELPGSGILPKPTKPPWLTGETMASGGDSEEFHAITSLNSQF